MITEIKKSQNSDTASNHTFSLPVNFEPSGHISALSTIFVMVCEKVLVAHGAVISLFITFRGFL